MGEYQCDKDCICLLAFTMYKRHACSSKSFGSIATLSSLPGTLCLACQSCFREHQKENRSIALSLLAKNIGHLSIKGSVMNILVELDRSEICSVTKNLEIIVGGGGPLVIIFEDSDRRITARKAHRIYTTKEQRNENETSRTY